MVRNVALVALVLSLIAGWLLSGAIFYSSAIGLDQSAFPGGDIIAKLIPASGGPTPAGVVWTVLSALGIAAVAGTAVARAARSETRPVAAERRRFLGAGVGASAAAGALVAAGAGATARAFFGLGTDGNGWRPVLGEVMERDIPFTDPDPREAWKGSRIAAHRRFGRTGWQVSDIVLGTGRIQGKAGEAIARDAIERGVNYFDTAPDYSGAGSEQAMGRAIRGLRDQVFIATKFCTPEGHLPTGSPVERYMQVIDESLARLGTEYVDLVHVHSCDEVDRLMDENVHEAFDRLKQQGKARFLGFSTHTPRLVEVANTAIDSGRFDVMMLAYHHGQWPEIPAIIGRARREQDMGVVAMKTLRGAKHRGLLDFAPYADAYSQAALKWALSNQDVSCAVISFFEPQHVDEYLYASGKPFGGGDLAVLEEYDRRIVGSYCEPHCGACLDTCPAQLPIHDVLRHRMYFEDYGQEKEAMRLYSKLERNASVCASCSAPCLGSCPEGIAIPTRMRESHQLLTLT